MRKFKAFTMFEIGLVMVIVTVLAGVTIRITKAKYDSVTSYLYYSAYDQLKESVSEVYTDMNSTVKKYETVTGSKYYIYDETTKTIVERSDTSTTPYELGYLCKPLNYFLNTTITHCPTGVSDLSHALENKGDFEDIADDDFPLVLANGMKLYNTNSDVVDLPFKLRIDNDALDTNPAKGYVIYVDIDGNKGESKLWLDIFPFYVTLTGMVVPAYTDTSVAPTDVDPEMGDVGAQSRDYMQASIYDNNAGEYLKDYKSITYQMAICQAGIIGGEYCKDSGTDINQITMCSITGGADCSVKIIAPLRLF